jgi:PEP-CTERM/exosortase A-associated glycosyltransferase
LKILHCFDHSIPLHSGYTFRSKAILEAQRRRGWTTVHVTSNKHDLKGPNPETFDGLEFFRTDKGSMAGIPILNQLDTVLTMSRRIEEVARIQKPNVIHAHSPSLVGWAAYRASRRLKIPLVYEIRAFWEDAAVDLGRTTETSARYLLSRKLETNLVARADAVMCICEGLKNDLEERNVVKKAINLIPNAIDVQKFVPLGERDTALEMSLNLKGQVVIGFIGSFYSYEGLDILVSAIAKIKERIPNIALLLVGGGNEEADLKAQVDSLGLSDIVKFTGRVPQEQVAAYSSLVDLFVFPRKKMRLTDLVTPLKPLEAMAQNRLVLASDVLGHKELVQHGNNGFLFTAGNVSALANEAVACLSLNIDEKRELQDRARTFVITERNWDSNMERYQKVYDRVLGDKVRVVV